MIETSQANRFLEFSFPTIRGVSRITTLFLVMVVTNKIFLTFCVGAVSLVFVNYEIVILTMIIVSFALSSLELYLESFFNKALCTAAKDGDIRIIKALKNCSKLDVNFPNNLGQSPLMLAAEGRHTNVVQALGEFEDINLNFSDIKGKTALMLAAEKGYADVVIVLRGFEDNSNFIHQAGRRITAFITWEEYKKPGIDPNRSDLNGKTAYRLAFENNHKHVLQELQKFKGINIATSLPETRVTPLNLATKTVYKKVLHVSQHALNHKKVKPIADDGAAVASCLVLTRRYLKNGEFRKAGSFLVISIGHGLDATLRIMTFNRNL